MKPSVGRVVWFWPLYLATFRLDGNHVVVNDPAQALRADVDFVNPDGTINVSGGDHEGLPYRALNVPLLEGDEPKPVDVSYCTWMPYQVGQAKKHDGEAGWEARIAALEATVRALMTPAATPPPQPGETVKISASDKLAATLAGTVAADGPTKSTP